MSKWKTVPCTTCHNGCGLVSDYSGGDFNGPKECPDCGGQGHYVVSESDRTALYPGGPFTGHAPGLYAETKGGAK